MLRLWLSMAASLALPKSFFSEQATLTEKDIHVEAVETDKINSRGAYNAVCYKVLRSISKHAQIAVSKKGQNSCHAYEADIRSCLGKPDNAEWATRAYELTWKAKGNFPATHFWLYAYDGKSTQCDVTFGPRT